MKIDAAGWMTGVRRLASPNCDARPQRTSVELLVIHNISLPPGEFGGAAVAELFTNCLDANAHPYFAKIAGLKVSSHFFIRRDGAVMQFVPCGKRAWHAGVSSWQGRSACNDFSIGIEMEGGDDISFTDQQYAVLARLTRRLRRNYPIRAIVGHADIAPGRKTDPGPCFDWGRYLGAGKNKA